MRSGWILLRAWNEDADPLVFDLYPYATTSPIYVDVAGRVHARQKMQRISCGGWIE